jgi:hypothetical protein
MRNLSCATAAQFKPTVSAKTGIANLRLGLIMSRPPLHAMQSDQLNRRESITSSAACRADFPAVSHPRNPHAVWQRWNSRERQDLA